MKTIFRNSKRNASFALIFVLLATGCATLKHWSGLDGMHISRETQEQDLYEKYKEGKISYEQYYGIVHHWTTPRPDMYSRKSSQRTFPDIYKEAEYYKEMMEELDPRDENWKIYKFLCYRLERIQKKKIKCNEN